MNANDTLRDYNCSERYHNYGLNLVLTDGVLALAQKFECFWFLDIIASYQPQLKGEEFQAWELTRYDDGSALVRCTDGNSRQLQSQEVEYTDFKPTTATVWVEYGTALLPSEH